MWLSLFASEDFLEYKGGLTLDRLVISVHQAMARQSEPAEDHPAMLVFD